LGVRIVKVVHVMPRFGPGGGIVQIVRETSRRLRERGDQVLVLTSSDAPEGGSGSVETTPEGISVRRFPRKGTGSVWFPMLAGLPPALSGDEADIVHAHNHRSGLVLQAARLARRGRLPLVVSTYYHPAQRHEAWGKKAAVRLLDVGFGIVAYERARSLVALTSFEAQAVRRFAPSVPIRVVPPGIDAARWGDPSSDRRDPRLPPEYFLYAGRLARTKGIPYLLRAVARLPPDVRRPLVLVGPDMGARAGLEAEARRLGIAGSVLFLGHVPDDAAYRGVVRGATALVLPSEWESFGIVLLEAMAARTAVVGSQVGAIPDVLEGGRAGRLVPFGDVDALSAALTAVVREPDRTAELVGHGFARARELDWARATDGIRAVYQEAIGR
jgi:glycosyltransferase involved in cell wall biosynthesis